MRFLMSPYSEESGSTASERQPLDDSLNTSSPVSPTSPSSPRRITFRSIVEKFSPQASTISDSYWGDQNERDVQPLAKRGLLFGKRNKKRLVFKGGECNLSYMNISKRRRMYFLDLFTTMIDLKWRFIFLIFALAFVGGWVMFALIWYIICITHDDHINKDNADWNKCVENVYDFQTALLFSIETQHTIGYGFRGMTPHCPVAVFFLMAQSCFGVMVNAMMAGLVFAKLSRPIKRGQTIIFSKNAVICQRDGQRYMLFRIADTRKSRLVTTLIRAVLVKKKVTAEGEVLPFYQHHLSVQPENEDDILLLVWPLTIMHKIDSSSPFYDLSAEQLLQERFEVIVYLEGTVEPTGMSTQVRTSYLPSEILWGHHLAPLMTYEKVNGQYFIDYTRFHNTIPTNMSELSAREQEKLHQQNTPDSEETSLQMECGVKKMVGSLPDIRVLTETPSGIQMENLSRDFILKSDNLNLDNNLNICNGNVV